MEVSIGHDGDSFSSTATASPRADEARQSRRSRFLSGGSGRLDGGAGEELGQTVDDGISHFFVELST
jgi:hypothetical protein